jgi:hypothetical protein
LGNSMMIVTYRWELEVVGSSRMQPPVLRTSTIPRFVVVDAEWQQKVAADRMQPNIAAERLLGQPTHRHLTCDNNSRR